MTANINPGQLHSPSPPKLPGLTHTNHNVVVSPQYKPKEPPRRLLKRILLQPIPLRQLLPSLLNLTFLAPLDEINPLLHRALSDMVDQPQLRRQVRDRRSFRKFHLARVRRGASELVFGNLAAEAVRELRPHVLPALIVAVDDVEGLIGAFGLERGPQGEGGVEARVGEGVEEGVEGFASGEDEGAVELLADGGVQAERSGEVHEVTCKSRQLGCLPCSQMRGC